MSECLTGRTITSLLTVSGPSDEVMGVEISESPMPPFWPVVREEEAWEHVKQSKSEHQSQP